MKNLIVLIALISGCSTDIEVVEAKKRELMQWRVTPEGVRYFITCAEGAIIHSNTEHP